MPTDWPTWKTQWAIRLLQGHQLACGTAKSVEWGLPGLCTRFQVPTFMPTHLSCPASSFMGMRKAWTAWCQPSRTTKIGLLPAFHSVLNKPGISLQALQSSGLDQGPGIVQKNFHFLWAGLPGHQKLLNEWPRCPPTPFWKCLWTCQHRRAMLVLQFS